MHSYRQIVDRKLADYRHAARQAREERLAFEQAQETVGHTLAAQKLIQVVAEKTQQSAHQKIASVVTKCLIAVFGEDEAYRFKIDFRSARGKTEARLLFVRNEMELEPMDASGGGTIDIAAMALRLACLVLSRPMKRRLLVLDEPMRFLSRDYIPAARAMLEMVSKELNVQIILVTHNTGLQVGKVIEVG